MPSYIIAIDQGTTSTRVCIFDENGQLLKQAQEEFKQHFPQPGWVEHDPQDIWRSTLKTLKAATASLNPKKIVGIGITNQRETALAWDAKTGSPIHPAIVWQCRRTQDACQRLRQKKLEGMIRKKTGLVIDPYFSATKLQWILKNVPGARGQATRGNLRLGTIDTYLIWKLTQGESHVTDVTNASRTMLMNLTTLAWDSDLLKLFKIPSSTLPQIRPSDSLFGVTRGLGFLPDGIPIHGVLGDQHAALFGQLAHRPGDAKCTFGTGSFILLNTGSQLVYSNHKLLSTLAWQRKGQNPIYALEGGAFICGAAVQWLRDGLRLFPRSQDIEALAQSVSSSEGVEFVPALVGLGAPYWNSEARGMISGLTRGTTRGHIAYATLEAMALQNVDILQAMEKDLGQKIRQLRVDGGAAKNDLLIQMQSDFLGTRVDRPVVFETTALGVAYMTGLGVGLFKASRELEGKWQLDRSFRPMISKTKRDQRQRSWQQALRRVEL